MEKANLAFHYNDEGVVDTHSLEFGFDYSKCQPFEPLQADFGVGNNGCQSGNTSAGNALAFQRLPYVVN